MKSRIFRSGIIFVAAVLIGFLVSISTIEAQTAKRKTNKPKQTLVYPSQPIVEPAIISRADDPAIEENQTTPVSEPIAQPPAETVDDKIDASNKRIKDLTARLKSLESTQKNEYDEKQKRLLLNLDILSRAEQRAESLRKQLFEIIEKESSVKSRLDQLDYDLRPDNIERTSAFSGSLRPEEIRDQRKKSLDAERKNLDALLTQIQNNRAVLEQSVDKADSLVEKVRAKMEKEIDDALAADDNQKP